MSMSPKQILQGSIETNSQLIGQTASGSFKEGSCIYDKPIDLSEQQKEIARQNIGAESIGASQKVVGNHNTAADSHNDIRILINDLTQRLDYVANSSDDDLDQIKEIVTYIKNNKSLIDGITTSKVNVTDIIDNLTINVANKPLSAAQGVVLKDLIDRLSDNKLDTSKLPEAIDIALAQAKDRGEFDGKTPVKGEDYFTEADKTELVNAVMTALPTAEGAEF